MAAGWAVEERRRRRRCRGQISLERCGPRNRPAQVGCWWPSRRRAATRAPFSYADGFGCEQGVLVLRVASPSWLVVAIAVGCCCPHAIKVQQRVRLCCGRAGGAVGPHRQAGGGPYMLQIQQCAGMRAAGGGNLLPLTLSGSQLAA